MPNMSRSNCIFPPWVSLSTRKCTQLVTTKRNLTVFLRLKSTKISRSFKQSLLQKQVSVALGLCWKFQGWIGIKKVKRGLLMHPTCCPSRLRHEPCPLEEAGGNILLNVSPTQGSLQAVSLSKIQLLPNQRLPLTYYIYNQKIHGVK